MTTSVCTHRRPTPDAGRRTPDAGPAPTLTVARGAGDLSLSWPASAKGDVLETKPLLDAGTWQVVPGVTGSSHKVSTRGAGGFYRLTSWSERGEVGAIDGLPRTVWTLGDSITYGASATAASNRWVNQLASANSWSVTNLAYGSATIPDLNWQAYPGFYITNLYDGIVYHSPSTISTNCQTAILAGFNDLRDFGTDSIRLATFERGLMALLTYVGIPSSQRVTAQAAAASGTWSSLAMFGGTMARESSTTTSTLTFTNLIGDTLYLCYLDSALTNGGGTFSVAVDENTIASVTSTNGYGNREYRNGSDANIPNEAGPTGNGKIDFCHAVLRIPGQGMGAHEMVVTVSNSATGPSRILWAAASGGSVNRAPQSGPFSWVGGAIRQAVWTGSGSDAAAANYSDAILRVVSLLRADGLRVRFVRAFETYDPITGVHPDGVHPSDAGMGMLAHAYIAATRLYFSEFATDRSLTVARGAEDLTLSWPASATGYVLKTKPSLDGD